MRRITFSLLALTACSNVDVIGAFVVRPAHDAGVDSPSVQPATPQPTAAEPSAPAVPQTPSRDATAMDPAPRAGHTANDTAPLDAGMESTPPAAIDPLCFRSGLDPSVCESARKLAFGHAVCGCADMLGTGSVSTETLAGASAHADVGTNGSYTLRISRRGTTSDLSGVIDGSLVIGGPGPSTIYGNPAEIHGLLELAGDLVFAGNVHVGGAVFSRDLPRGNGTLQIDGDLHHATQRPATLPANVQVTGSVLEDDYVTIPPCACGPINAPELASLIVAAESGNDDTHAQLTPSSLSSLTAARSVSLDCGRYYFNDISSLSSLSVQIAGQVAIFVGGDVSVRGDVAFNLAPDAELDLLIGGNLSLAGAARFGDPARPGASRIYVKGGVELATNADLPALVRPSSASGDALFVGNLYAPAATLQVAPHSDVYGSLFVKQLIVLQSLFVHYDPSVTTQHGARCER
jgi:hypothetical protein